MKLLTRGPQGQFIDYGSALFHWLPVLLDRGMHPLETMLECAMRFCEKEAANDLRINADYIVNSDYDVKDAESINFFGVRRAQKWDQRRTILREALLKLKAQQ